PNTEQVIKEIPSADIQKLKINIRKAIGVIFDDMI
ncbi:flagellar protein FlaG, partial [Treponema porcinum]